MKKIQVVPGWSFRDDSGNQLDPKLFKLLHALDERGKLTAAAKDAGISYRHGWNLLNKWAAFFGSPLVELQKGRGAWLTPLGEKLLWAEKRVIARLEPQIENLASELNIEIERTLEGIKPTLRLHASHGYAVALLPRFADQIQLDLQYKSAEDALAALNRGACDLAGFHVPVDMMSESLIATYSHQLKPRGHKIIRFISRTQGLMVKAGNPKAVHTVADLSREDVRFINRQKNSGTRALLDELLRREAVNAAHITGFVDEEFTHSAVAAFVAAGMADVGFGVEASAHQFGLEFIPVTTELYLLLCHQRALGQEAIQRFLESIRSDKFQQAVRALPGYEPVECGKVVAIESLLPWYRKSP
ncbi:MAG: substrate-binding domain-containing protein [Pontibacterium sp.]